MEIISSKFWAMEKSKKNSIFILGQYVWKSGGKCF